MEKKKNISVNIYIIRRILILLFCFFIGISVAVVMFFIYKPNQNALGALSSVSMDIVCIVMLFILLESFALDKYGLKQTSKLFVGMLVATLWAIFLDFLNWAFDGSLEFGHLTFWFTAGSLCMGSVMAALFSLYLYSYMDEIHDLKQMRIHSKVCTNLNILSFIVTVTLALTGTAFTFVDGHYEVGALYDIVTVIPILSLIYLTLYVILHIKKIGFHDVFAVTGYIFFMIVGALIESFYRVGTTYVAVVIADIFIYVMLQNVIIAQEKHNTQEWMQKSRLDGLTGFLNRYAYEEYMNMLEENGVMDDFVYVSMDVNSLKLINDSLGHSAGDEMIIGATQCIRQCFGPYGKLYRIGGDEFIALIQADKQELQRIQRIFEETINAWHGKLVDKLTISCGYITKDESEDMSVRKMAISADQKMYDAKREYYQKTGIERRKR